MSLLPPRRWFQFKLTTWFVLVGILAWAMLEWPYYHLTEQKYAVTRGEFVSSGSTDGRRGTLVGGGIEKDYADETQSTTYYLKFQRRHPNPGLLWPVLVLAAFVGWKGLWILREHFRSRPQQR